MEKIEGNVVTIEDGDNHFNLNKTEISFSINEGDVIQLINGEYYPDEATTKNGNAGLLLCRTACFPNKIIMIIIIDFHLKGLEIYEWFNV